MFHRISLIIIPLVVFLFSGCVQNKIPVNGNKISSQGVEDADYNCSYFYFLWGRYEELHQRFAEALQAYEKALICDLDEEYIKKKIPVLLLRMERTDEAILWLDEYLLEQPDDSEMRLVAAQAALKNGNVEKATAEYKTCMRLDKENLVAYILLGELYISQKEFKQAEAILKEALELNKQQFQVHLSLARCYQLQQNFSQAIHYYEQALTFEWSDEVLLEIGKLYSKSRNSDKAVETFQKILTDDETNTSAMIELVNTLQIKKEYQQAIKYLQQLKVYSEYPQRVDLTIAKLLAKQQKIKEALILVEALVEKEPIPEARFLLAKLYSAEQQYLSALNQLSLIEGEKKYSADVLLLQIQIYQWIQQPTKAIELVKSALNDPLGRSSGLYSVLAALYTGEKKNNKAEQAYTEGIQAFPDDDSLLYEYGIHKESNGDRNQALEIMHQVITLNPDHVGALNFIGYTWADDNVHLDKALNYIQRAVRLTPDSGFILDSLGWVYYRLGKYTKAKNALEKAVQLSPEDAAIYDHLGDVYYKIGKLKEAHKSYERAVELSEDEKEMQGRVQQKLDSIKPQLGEI